MRTTTASVPDDQSKDTFTAALNGSIAETSMSSGVLEQNRASALPTASRMRPELPAPGAVPEQLVAFEYWDRGTLRTEWVSHALAAFLRECTTAFPSMLLSKAAL